MTGLEKFDIKFVKGVGEVRAKLLAAELGIHSMRDLLYTFPFRYIDRSRYFKIADFEADSPNVQVKGRFIRFDKEGEGVKSRVKGLFSDGDRLMEVVWFSRGAKITSGLSTGKEYVIFGKPSNFKGVWSMAHPEIEIFDPQKPPQGHYGVYSLTEILRKKNLNIRTLRNIIRNAMLSREFSQIKETLPAEVISAHKLMPIGEALRQMHFPENHDMLRKARERFKFEELYHLNIHILRFARYRNHKVKGRVLPRVGEMFNRFYKEIIPFDLTSAQKRVIREIRKDMISGRQMNRLLQGDVGCGKTMVAFMTMLIAADNGLQACLMAPTEILASQHYETLSEWCEKLGLKVALLTGSVRTSRRREIHEGLLSGDINFLVGTHALIEESVQFRELGLAIIDEQHRFGVAQRARIWNKSDIAPHVLVMTATPIPRTLAMTVYGDLDISVIDELPPGRKPVQTILRYDENRHEVNRLIYSQLAVGRQAYIVYPLIKENEKLTLKSLEEGYRYACETFPKFKVCYVHGKMTPAEKEYQMNLFVTGEASILVSTTVIEVGVNVPNASVMVIENAERFGLSQLHQLRGRVGRGAAKSYCILMSHIKLAADSRKRLEAMTATNDGFLLAETDMQMRGPGDMEGTQQSGLAFNLRLASLATDAEMLEITREAAVQTLSHVPSIAHLPGEDTYCAESIRILNDEAALRFRNDRDWSQIS